MIAHIVFHGILADNSSGVVLADWLLADTDGIALPATAQDGLVHVSGAARIEGVVTLQGRTDHSGSEVCALDGVTPVACTVVGGTGAFSLDVPPGTYTVRAERESYLCTEKSGVVATTGTTTLATVQLRGGNAVVDAVINIQDLAFMGSRYGTSCGDPGYAARGDINGDCTINIQDIAMTGGNYLRTCPQPWP